MIGMGMAIMMTVLFAKPLQKSFVNTCFFGTIVHFIPKEVNDCFETNSICTYLLFTNENHILFTCSIR